MAIIKTEEIKGTQPVPITGDVAELLEVMFRIDAAKTPLAIGDFVQLMHVPDNAVLSDIRVGVSAAIGAATVAVGIADAAATTAIPVPLVAAASPTVAAPLKAGSAIMGDNALASHTDDQRLLVAQIGGAAVTAGVIYIAVTYRNARYGK